MASPSPVPESSGTQAPQLRKDFVTNRWVIFSPARAKRPTDFKSKSPQNPSSNPVSCPFCIGNEHECAPEIFRVPCEPEWKIRVIENLYPALSRNIGDPFGQSDEPGEETGALGQALAGFGFHDVVIETPVHSVQLYDLSATEAGDVFLAYRKRIEQIATYDAIKYVQVFKNHGASSGASMSHSHSQILALPIIPPTVSSRLDGMKGYFNQRGKCSLCEVKPTNLLIDESKYFVSIVPFAATYPFEIWIIPLHHSSDLRDLDAEKAVDLGGLLTLTLRKMSLQLNNPPFNFMIHTSPLHVIDSQLPYSHWFLQIVPLLSGVGGFEIGTGCYINPVLPEDAAKVLREVKLP